MAIFPTQVTKKKKFDKSIGAWFDRLQRVNYASANLAKILVEGNEEDALKAIRRGLTGQDKTTYSDVLTELGFEPKTTAGKFAKGAAGFVGDVLLDPTTYIPVGGILAKGGKGLRKVPGVSKALTAVRGTRPVQTAGKLFSTKFMPKGVDETQWKLLQKAKDLAERYKGKRLDQAYETSIDILTDIKKTTKQGSLTPKILDDLLENIESKGLKGGISEDIVPIRNKIIKYRDDISSGRAKIGKSLIDESDYDYLPHIVIDKAKGGMEGVRKYSTKSGSDYTRDILKFTSQKNPANTTISTAKRLGVIPTETPNIFKNPKTRELFTAKQAGIVETEKAFGKQFFSKDIPKLTYTMGKRLANQEGATKFIKVIKRVGSKDPTKGIASTIPELKGLHFSEPIQKEIDKIIKAYVSDEPTNAALKVWDKVQEYWKIQTLGIFPAYHARNIVGNIWNAFLGGTSDPRVYTKSTVILRKIRKGIPLAGDELKAFNLAKKNRILGKGIMGAEIPTLTPSEISKASSFVQATKKPAQFGMKVGTEIEDIFRFGHFIDRMDKGDNAYKAALSVKKHLFDYADLTDFERNVMKRIFPFYTWTRKNLPLQLEAIIKQPQKAVGFEKLRKSFEKVSGVTEEDKALMPEWAKKRQPFWLPTKGKEKRYFPTESWIPLADIQKLERPADVIGELLSPLVKIPIEMKMNRIFYFDRPIQEYKGQTREMFKRDVPVYLEYLLRQARLLNEADRLIGRKEESTSMPQPKFGERAFRFYTGIKIYRYEVEKAKRAKAWQIKQELGKLKIGLNKAEKYKRTEEYKRILPKIEELENQLKGINPLK